MSARYPGATHDAAIWQMSNIKRYLHDQYLNGVRNIWLLGDSGYPLQPWLLTPIIGGEEGSPEKRYTDAHKLTRNCIERLNGTLKGRFRCLLKHRVLHYEPNLAGQIVYSCSVLHNICIAAGLEQNEDEENNIDDSKFNSYSIMNNLYL